MRIGTRLRKIWRDIWARKVRTLLVSISIFIGVFGVVTLFSAGEILIKQLEQDLQQDKLAMIRLAVVTSSEARINNQSELQRLRDLPGVAAISGRAVYRVAWKLPADRIFEDGYIAAYTEPFDQVVLEPPTLYQGNWPQADQNQIAVERRFAEKYDLQIGDQIDFRILSSAAANTTESWTISGLIFQPYGEPGGAGPLDPDQIIFAAYPDAQYIAGFNGLSHIYARYTDFATAEDQEEEFEAAIQSYAVSFTNIEDPADNGTIAQTRTINRLLVILALIALIVSGFLVFNVINAIVVEQRRQIGVLKSLGASRLDSFFIYSGIAVMYGLIGVIPGVLLGIPAGFVAAKGLAGQSGTIIEEFSFTPTGVILGVVIGLAVPFLSSILPVFNGTRVSILEAMTDFGINARYGRGPLARLISMLPLSITFRQALNIVNQKKFRLALIGTTLTVAVAAFMGIYAVFSSLTGKIDEVFTTIGSQFSINPSEGRSYDELVAALQGIDGISAAEPGATLSIKIEGYEDAPPVVAGPPGLFAFGINPSNPDIAPLSMKSGAMLTADSPANAVVISSRIADYMDKKEGDTVIIRSRDQVDEFNIIGVASYPYDTVWFRWDTLAKLGGLVIGAPDGMPYPNQIDVIMAQDDPAPAQVDDKIAEVKEALLAQGITADFTNWVDFNQSITRYVTLFGLILNLAAALIAVVGAIGLLTSLSMSVFERQKEIGVMRSVGASSWAVTIQFLVEGLVVGIAAWAIGVPLSYLLSRGLGNALPFGDVFEIGYPPITLVIGLAGMLVIVTIASLWPSLSAARKTVSDILRYQ